PIASIRDWPTRRNDTRPHAATPHRSRRDCGLRTAAAGWESPVMSSSSMHAASGDKARSGARRLRRADCRFRPEHLAYLIVRLDVRPADQVEAIRHCREDAVERFLDRLRL